MKQPLPAKYAKMTVCTFWILKKLKTMGMLTEEQMAEAAKEFNLTKENDDQILYFKDLVENFKDHEGYLKMYANASKLDLEEEDDDVKLKEENPVPTKVPTKQTNKKKKECLSDEELRRMLYDDSGSEDDKSDDDRSEDDKSEDDRRSDDDSDYEEENTSNSNISNSDTSDSDTSDSDTSYKQTSLMNTELKEVIPIKKKFKLIIKK